LLQFLSELQQLQFFPLRRGCASRLAAVTGTYRVVLDYPQFCLVMCVGTKKPVFQADSFRC